MNQNNLYFSTSPCKLCKMITKITVGACECVYHKSSLNDIPLQDPLWPIPSPCSGQLKLLSRLVDL
jgi:hypothetical protein